MDRLQEIKNNFKKGRMLLTDLEWLIDSVTQLQENEKIKLEQASDSAKKWQA
jgi:hypothetical protein